MPRARKTEAVRLKELDILQSVVANPLVLYVAGFAAIELFQKWDIVGDVAGTGAEIALASVAVATALGPSLGALAPALADIQEPGVLDKIKGLLPG